MLESIRGIEKVREGESEAVGDSSWLEMFHATAGVSIPTLSLTFFFSGAVRATHGRITII